jgi:hypothetical protein
MLDPLEISVAPHASPGQHLSRPIGAQVIISTFSSRLVYRMQSIALRVLLLTTYGLHKQYSGC